MALLTAFVRFKTIASFLPFGKGPAGRLAILHLTSSIVTTRIPVSSFKTFFASFSHFCIMESHLLCRKAKKEADF
jgi:hypothetical protein